MSRLVSVNTQVLADPEKLFQPAACSASLHTTVTQGLSPCQLTLKTTTAHALTLLLHNQHALAAALEGVTKWISENGVESVAANPMGAMEALVKNARTITDAIMRLRKL